MPPLRGSGVATLLNNLASSTHMLSWPSENLIWIFPPLYMLFIGNLFRAISWEGDVDRTVRRHGGSESCTRSDLRCLGPLWLDGWRSISVMWRICAHRSSKLEIWGCSTHDGQLWLCFTDVLWPDAHRLLGSMAYWELFTEGIFLCCKVYGLAPKPVGSALWLSCGARQAFLHLQLLLRVELVVALTSPCDAVLVVGFGSIVWTWPCLLSWAPLETKSLLVHKWVHRIY